MSKRNEARTPTRPPGRPSAARPSAANKINSDPTAETYRYSSPFPSNPSTPTRSRRGGSTSPYTGSASPSSPNNDAELNFGANWLDLTDVESPYYKHVIAGDSEPGINFEEVCNSLSPMKYGHSSKAARDSLRVKAKEKKTLSGLSDKEIEAYEHFLLNCTGTRQNQDQAFKNIRQLIKDASDVEAFLKECVNMELSVSSKSSEELGYKEGLVKRLLGLKLHKLQSISTEQLRFVLLAQLDLIEDISFATLRLGGKKPYDKLGSYANAKGTTKDGKGVSTSLGHLHIDQKDTDYYEKLKSDLDSAQAIYQQQRQKCHNLNAALREPFIGNVGDVTGTSSIGTNDVFSRLQVIALSKINRELSVERNDREGWAEVFMRTGDGKTFLAENYLERICDEKGFEFRKIDLATSDKDIEETFFSVFKEVEIDAHTSEDDIEKIFFGQGAESCKYELNIAELDKLSNLTTVFERHYLKEKGSLPEDESRKKEAIHSFIREKINAMRGQGHKVSDPATRVKKLVISIDELYYLSNLRGVFERKFLEQKGGKLPELEQDRLCLINAFIVETILDLKKNGHKVISWGASLNLERKEAEAKSPEDHYEIKLAREKQDAALNLFSLSEKQWECSCDNVADLVEGDFKSTVDEKSKAVNVGNNIAGDRKSRMFILPDIDLGAQANSQTGALSTTERKINFASDFISEDLLRQIIGKDNKKAVIFPVSYKTPDGLSEIRYGVARINDVSQVFEMFYCDSVEDKEFGLARELKEKTDVISLFDMKNSIGGDYGIFSLNASHRTLALDNFGDNADGIYTADQLMQYCGRDRSAFGTTDEELANKTTFVMKGRCFAESDRDKTKYSPESSNLKCVQALADNTVKDNKLRMIATLEGKCNSVRSNRTRANAGTNYESEDAVRTESDLYDEAKTLNLRKQVFGGCLTQKEMRDRPHEEMNESAFRNRDNRTPNNTPVRQKLRSTAANVSQLNAEHDRLQQRIKELKRLLGNLGEMEPSAFIEKYNKLLKDLERLRERSQRADDLEAQMTALHLKLNEAKLGELELDQLKERLKELEEELAKEKQRANDAESFLSKAQKDNSALLEKFDALTADNANLTKSLRDEAEKSSDLENRLRDSKAREDELRSKEEENTKKLQDLEKELTQKDTELGKLKKAAQDSEAEMSALKKNAEESEREVQNLQSQLVAMQEKLNLATDGQDDKEQKLQEFLAKIQELQNKLLRATTERDEALTQLSELQKEVAALKESEAKARAQVDETKALAENLQKELENSKKEVEAEKEKSDQLTERLKESENKKQEFEEVLDASRQDLENMQAQLSSKDDELKNAKEELQEKERALKESQERVAGDGVSSQEHNELKSKLSEAQSALSASESNLEDLKGRLAKNEKELNDAKEKVREREEELEKQRPQDPSGELSNVTKEDYAALQDELKKLRDEAEKATALIANEAERAAEEEELRKENKELRGKNAELEGKLSGVWDALRDLQDQTTRLEKRAEMAIDSGAGGRGSGAGDAVHNPPEMPFVAPGSNNFSPGVGHINQVSPVAVNPNGVTPSSAAQQSNVQQPLLQPIVQQSPLQPLTAVAGTVPQTGQDVATTPPVGDNSQEEAAKLEEERRKLIADYKNKIKELEEKASAELEKIRKQKLEEDKKAQEEKASLERKVQEKAEQERREAEKKEKRIAALKKEAEKNSLGAGSLTEEKKTSFAKAITKSVQVTFGLSEKELKEKKNTRLESGKNAVSGMENSVTKAIAGALIKIAAVFAERDRSNGTNPPDVFELLSDNKSHDNDLNWPLRTLDDEAKPLRPLSSAEMRALGGFVFALTDKGEEEKIAKIGKGKDLGRKDAITPCLELMRNEWDQNRKPEGNESPIFAGLSEFLEQTLQESIYSNPELAEKQSPELPPGVIRHLREVNLLEKSKESSKEFSGEASTGNVAPSL